MIRFIRAICAALVFLWSTAAAPTTVPRVRAIVLDGANYLLCPPSASSREACLRDGGTPGAGAIDEVRTDAHAPGVDHVVFFLSGFRTRYDETALIAQRLASVLGPRFLVVFADWGSHGLAVGYEADALAAKHNTPALAALLADLHRAMPDRPIDVFAHSMGARLAAGAMATCPHAADGSHVVDEAVLAAPDISLSDYRRAITRMPETFGHVTIYVSRADHALVLSEVIHLHHRLGQVTLWKHTMANTDVVDASAADRVADGHGYAIHDTRVMRDIGDVLIDAPVPHADWLRRNSLWVLEPAKISAQ
jgi:esterase/lipase superfamily enzyme